MHRAATLLVGETSGKGWGLTAERTAGQGNLTAEPKEVSRKWALASATGVRGQNTVLRYRLINRLSSPEDDNTMQRLKWTAVLCTLILGAATRAHAQMVPWDDRGYVMVNLGVQPQSQTFTEVSTPVIYGENASISVPHHIGSGLLFDLSGGYRVWKNLAVGLGYSRFSDSEKTTVAAEIPNPLIFGSPRSASATTGDLSHSESAVHVQLLWNFPLTDKIEIAAIAGPSFFKVGQDLVSDVATEEGPVPFGTVTITSVGVASTSKWATGVSAGLDATYLLRPKIGVGGFIRFSGAKADLPTIGGGTISVDAGGFQMGAGLRYRF
jgi:hypothetical protein